MFVRRGSLFPTVLALLVFIWAPSIGAEEPSFQLSQGGLARVDYSYWGQPEQPRVFSESWNGPWIAAAGLGTYVNAKSEMYGSATNGIMHIRATATAASIPFNWTGTGSVGASVSVAIRNPDRAPISLYFATRTVDPDAQGASAGVVSSQLGILPANGHATIEDAEDTYIVLGATAGVSPTYDFGRRSYAQGVVVWSFDGTFIGMDPSRPVTPNPPTSGTTSSNGGAASGEPPPTVADPFAHSPIGTFETPVVGNYGGLLPTYLSATCAEAHLFRAAENHVTSIFIPPSEPGGSAEVTIQFGEDGEFSAIVPAGSTYDFRDLVPEGVSWFKITGGGVLCDSSAAGSRFIVGLTFADDGVQSMVVSSQLPSWAIAGDIDLDGDVSRADAALFTQYLGMEQRSVWNTGDFNADGLTNMGDFALLQSNLGRTVATSPALAAIPEPAGFTLAATAMILACGHFIRKRAPMARSPR